VFIVPVLNYRLALPEVTNSSLIDARMARINGPLGVD
jgi:hypothetical protein